MAYDLLLYLVGHPGQLVSRETLQQHLWPDVSVSDAALARLVKEARRAVGDSGRRQAVIETRRGRGFRFVAKLRDGRANGEVAYVGRSALLVRLDELIDAACSGRGRALLLAGEPGMGKTRTAEELVERARQRGVRPARAWAAEGLETPGYWPWIQVLRDLLDPLEPAALRRALGPSAHVVARLVPELLEQATGRAPPPQDGATERFRLFDAIGGVLRRCARDRPLVLVLDDLHWADAQSVELLDLLAHDLPAVGIAVLATYREPELARQPALADPVARLARRPGVERQRLEGLSSDETRRFIECFTGRVPDAQVAERLRERTEGSPLFLGVVAQAAGEAPASDDAARWEEVTARGLSSVIADRVRTLSPEARRALRCAAVIGRDFELDLLARVLGVPLASVDDLLREVLAARLLTASRRSYVPALRFAHDLFREALYAELDGEECAATHARVAAALEVPGPGPEPDLDRLAHHVYQALPVLGSERAIEVAERAGWRAMESHAYDVAERHYRRAAELLDERESVDALRLCRAQIRLGEAERGIGRHVASQKAFLRAAGLAREKGGAVHLARAALGFAGPHDYGPPCPEIVSLLGEAAGALDAPDEALRARVLGRLASELMTDPDPTRPAELRRQAWESAQLSGDVAATVELVGQGIWEAVVEPARRLDLARGYVEWSRNEGLRRVELAARVQLLHELLGRGEIEALDREARRADRLAREILDPNLLWIRRLQRFSRALLGGRLEEAEQHGREAHVFALRHLSPRAAYASWGRQLAVLRAAQGRLPELEESWTRLCRKVPTVSNLVLFAWVGAAAGDAPLARRLLEELCAERGAPLASEPVGCANAAVLAEVSAQLCIAQHAETLLALLRPYAGMNALRTYAACHGPVDHFRGLLERLRGREQEARRCFEAAVELAERMGAEPWAARSRTSCSLR